MATHSGLRARPTLCGPTTRCWCWRPAERCPQRLFGRPLQNRRNRPKRPVHLRHAHFRSVTRSKRRQIYRGSLSNGGGALRHLASIRLQRRRGNMRRTVTVATLGVLAAATTALLGPGADARQHAPDEDRQAGAIEIGTSDEVDAELSYASTRHETLTYRGAGDVKVHCDEWQPADGDAITAPDPAPAAVRRCEADSGPGWSTSISGDTAVVRLHTFQGLMPDRMDEYGAKIDAVAHEMTPEEKQESHSKDPLLESVCGQDDQKNAVCYESEEPEVFANTAPVARLLIDGTTMC